MSILAHPEIDASVFPWPEVELIEKDGEPLESDWHRLEMTLLIEVVTYYHALLGRLDYFVGGNMFIYFNEQQARDRDYRGPDFFYVNGGVSLNPPRPYWAIWKEGGRYPDLLIELSSPTTIKQDQTTKKDIYENVFRTHEYLLYDPEAKKLTGWRLVNHKYEPIRPDARGWLWSEQLQLWLGPWQGTFQDKEAVYVRCYDAAGRLIPTQAEANRAQAEANRAQAEANRAQAETERQRAERAEQEVSRLRALLEQRQEKGE